MAGPVKKKVEIFNPMAAWNATLDSKQYELSDSDSEGFWIEEPVDPETFHSHPDYLGIRNRAGPTLSDPQREFMETIADFENGKKELVIWCGKGGGKNHVTCVAFLYVVYKLLCMRNPHKYFNRSAVKPMTLLNVAINSTQGVANFFVPLSNMLRAAGTKAFKQFGFNAEKDIQSKIITFPKSIQIVSGHSSSGGVEGYDLFCALLDELDSSDFHSVSPMWTTLKSSSESRFHGKQKIMAISYSRYEGSNGMIRRLYQDNLDNPNAYVKKYPSWEFNPDPAYTRESLESEFMRNPDEARTIYGSDPPDGFLDSWIKDSQRIKNAMRGRQWILGLDVPHTDYRSNMHTESNQMNHNTGNWDKIDPFDIPINVRGLPGIKYVFCGDPALGNKETAGDGYGVCLGHRESVILADGMKYVRPVIDFSFRFTGHMFPTGEVQMAAIEELIDKLKRYGYEIFVYSFDAWNSAGTMQKIQRDQEDAVVHKHVVNNEDYKALRDAIFGEAAPTTGDSRSEHNGGIELPWHPILFNELKELRFDKSAPSRKGPDHPEGGTKDIADVVARAVNILVYDWPIVDLFLADGKLSDNTQLQEKMSHEEKVNQALLGTGTIPRKQKGFN